MEREKLVSILNKHKLISSINRWVPGRCSCGVSTPWDEHVQHLADLIMKEVED